MIARSRWIRRRRTLLCGEGNHKHDEECTVHGRHLVTLEVEHPEGRCNGHGNEHGQDGIDAYVGLGLGVSQARHALGKAGVHSGAKAEVALPLWLVGLCGWGPGVLPYPALGTVEWLFLGMRTRQGKGSTSSTYMCGFTLLQFSPTS